MSLLCAVPKLAEEQHPYTCKNLEACRLPQTWWTKLSSAGATAKCVCRWQSGLQLILIMNVFVNKPESYEIH
jgi:hypothetical protein